MKVKCIKLFLGEHEIGRAYEGRFECLLEPGPFMPDVKQWFEDCFFGLETGSADFQERWKLIESNKYFCFSKPSLKLIACEVDE